MQSFEIHTENAETKYHRLLVYKWDDLSTMFPHTSMHAAGYQNNCFLNIY